MDLSYNYLQGEIPLSISLLPVLANDYGLFMTRNCSLYSNDPDVQQFIVDKDQIITSYPIFLKTQGHCIVITPLIMYLLN